MKYSTLLVPVVTVACATLAAALPTDASVAAAGYPSDQGKYKPEPKQPKADKEEQTPFPKLAAAPKLPAQLPLPVSSLPVNPEAVENRLPIKAVQEHGPAGATGALPLHALPTNELPVSPPTQAVPFKALPTNELPASPPTQAVPFKALPTNEIPATPGFLPKLPISVPPKLPVVRRSHTHLVRDKQAKKDCGHLRVMASDNKFSGFVSANVDSNGRYTVVKNAKDGVLVDLEGHDLLFRSDVSVYPALGATYGVMHDNNASVDNMQGNSANFAMLTGTSQTAFGKRDMDGLSSFNDATGASQKIESAIYSFGENNEIHATWINTNNQPIPIQFGVNPDGEIIMSANVGQYAAMYGGKSAQLFCSGTN